MTERAQIVEYVPGTAVVPAQTNVALSIAAQIERHNLVVDFVQRVLLKGVDFGVIPGTRKPFLWKPGAEKLAAFFGFHPWLERVSATEDWETPFFAYTFNCKVMHGTELVATCEGASNSREPCYAKQNIYTLQNAVLKRAQKRALVGAVQVATSSSEFFAQSMNRIEVEEEEQQQGDTTPISEAGQIVERLQEKAGKIKTAQDIPAGAQGALKGKIAEALHDKTDKARHLLLRRIWGKEHVGELTYAEFNATANWLIAGKDPKTGDYPLRPEGVHEALAVFNDAQKQAGQLELGDLFGPEVAGDHP
jgi:hypothetical protein